MTTYYVRKDGNDTTGNGSTGTPWLTIHKGLASIAAGDTLLIGDGTYAENSGSGYLNIAKNAASQIIIAAELGAAGNVIIVGTAGSYNTMVNGTSANLTFRYIKFGAIAGSSYPFRIRLQATNIALEDCTFIPANGCVASFFVYTDTATITNVTFTRCDFQKPAVGAAHVCVDLHCLGTGAIAGMTFTDCTIDSISYGVRLDNFDNTTFTNCTIRSLSRGVTFDNLPDATAFVNCTITGGAEGVWVNGATHLSFTGGSISNTGATHCALFGVDGEVGGLATTVTITGTRIVHRTDVAGHGLILGDGCTGCVVDGVYVPAGYDHGIVLKECNTNEVKNSISHAGAGTATSAALYCKAAVNANCHNNRLYAAQGFAFRLLVGGTGNKCQNVTFKNNTLFGSGAGRLFQWGTAADDAGGGVCDYNIYKPGGSGKFGIVWADNDVQTLAELRNAWNGYDVAGNDANSRLWSDGGITVLLAKRSGRGKLRF